MIRNQSSAELTLNITLAGKVHSLHSNQALLLTQPQVIWFVSEGTVDVFSTRIEDDTPVSLRRHLFPAPKRRALFCSVPTKESNNLGFLGVASGPTKVVEVPLASYLGMLFDSPTRPGYLAEWVSSLGLFLTQEGLTPPTAITLVSDDGEREMIQKEALEIAQDRLMCVRVLSGNLNFLGYPNLAVKPEDGWLLFGPNMWLEVGSATAKLSLCTLETAHGRGLLAEGLKNLARNFNGVLRLRQEAEEVEELRRRMVSRELRDLETDQALEELSAVLDPEERFPKRETPLLTALTVIGNVMGVSIAPPSTSEDLTRVDDPVEAIARASRLRYRKVLLGPDWWKQDSGPLLGYLGAEERKPVALIPSGGDYVMVDPEKRLRQRLTPALRDELCLEAYMLYRGLPGRGSSVWDLMRFTAQGKMGDMVFLLLMGVAATLLGMITPRVTGALVDTAIPSADRSLLVEFALLLTVAGVAGAFCTYLQVMTTVRTSISTELVSQSALWDRLLKLRADFIRRYSSGDLEARTNVITEISRELGAATLRPLISGVLALLNFLLLWYYSWDLAKIAIWIGLAVLVVTLLFSHFIRRLSFKLNDLEGAFNGLMIQMIGGVGKLRVAGGEFRAFNYWVARYTPLIKLHQRVKLFKDMMHVFNIAVPVVAATFIFWKASKLATGLPFDDPDRITIGDFIAFNTAFVLYLAGWTDVSNTLVSILDSAMKSRRVKPLLEAEPEVADDAADPGRLKGNIQLEQVTFRYRRDGPQILNTISLKIQPGEFVAFVGPSGSGKSTLLRVLLGFERPEEGRVLYDGQDLAGMDALAVRRQLGTVLQNGRLNAGSILNNISNNTKISHAEAWEAVGDAGFTEDIELMPMGLHTMVAEGGANLSGGQRQRLLIARALVARPKIVLFDEATSALDNKTQATVSQAMDRRKVTRVVIAHRLSTIRQADRIYVLDRGSIVQVGTFEELRQQEGVFKELIARQLV